jgi:L-seryl-tRNA(Ser) seleniumtransferase
MVEKAQAFFRKIPGVDRLLESSALTSALKEQPRSLIIEAIHQVLEELRRKITRKADQMDESELTIERISKEVLQRIASLSRTSLIPLINGTGIVIHTNLGRSILAESVLDRFAPLAGGYSNLEYDLKSGKRGSRYVHLEGILKELTGADAATVVNNNAAAVLISLETLAKGREVIVSRGQLVEIGGSFRIPEVMKKSGARLVEVGATNRTRIEDYEAAITPETALLLKVHTSNYQIVGFTQEVPLGELVALGDRRGIAVMEDLGSGCFIDFSKYGLAKEPTVQEVLAEKPDIVTFSGDKLLGGAQAGIILGKAAPVDAIRRNQLNRALRIDKLTLLSLEETLRLYRDERKAIQEIPTLRMICQPYEELMTKAEKLVRLAGTLDSENFEIDFQDGSSKAGGGSLPSLELPSRLVCLHPKRLPPSWMATWLRKYDPPIIGRLEKETVILDVRTIQENEMSIVAQAIKELAALRPSVVHDAPS